MFSSPAKRRKTSETGAVAVDASHTERSTRNETDQTRSLRRPSFQSPTRSSLARSHPDVLARAASRIPTRTTRRAGGADTGISAASEQQDQTETSNIGLRDRKALRPSLTPGNSPLKPIAALGLSPTRRASGIQAFAVRPRRVSRRIASSDFVLGSPPKRPPIPVQDAASALTPEGQLASELDFATGAAQAQDQTADFFGVPQDEFGEPDLPPTPAQLTLEPALDEPHGPLSSSPSRRIERRRRRRTVEVVEPSPLKAGATLYETGDQIRTGDANLEFSIPQGHLPEDVREKLKLQRELSAELRRLKSEMEELEQWTTKLGRDGSYAQLDGQDWTRFTELLSAGDPHRTNATKQRAPSALSSFISSLLPFATKVPPRAAREPSPFPINPFALHEAAQSEPYLTTFAPLTLETHSSRVVSSAGAPLTETHTLTLSPPLPFPRHIYRPSITYETQPETQTLLSVSLQPDSPTTQLRLPVSLRRWADSRLANPLLRLDVSGLCWGINRYWEASISRAQMWAKLAAKHPNLTRTARLRPKSSDHREADDMRRIARWDDSSHESLTKADLRLLLPHFERNSMVFTAASDGAAGSSGAEMLLTCTLTLDECTSEPLLGADISVSTPSYASRTGVGRKIERESKKLFRALLNARPESRNGDGSGRSGAVSTDDIVRAVEGVIGVVFGVAQSAVT